MLDASAKLALSDLLREIRGHKTQRQLGEEIGISPGTINIWEKGNGGDPSLENLSILASYLGQNPEELLANLFGRHCSTKAPSSIFDQVSKLCHDDALELLVYLSQLVSDRYKSKSTSSVDYINASVHQYHN